MDKRYQVFVSSTFRDLEEERQEVMHALLELDCLPAGMELFPAANDSQWDLIKKVIDDSDYYILIIGGRYGSIGPEGYSYTEMEYRYALSVDKPTIAFLHRDPGNIVASKSEDTEEGRRKLADFRAVVEKKLCKHWTSPQDLGSVVSRSLIQLIKSNPAVGWVRASEVADRETTAELLRLRRQIDEMEEELKSARTTAPKGTEAFAQGEEALTIDYGYTARLPGFTDRQFKDELAITWDDIFAFTAPIMIDEADENSIKDALNDQIRAITLSKLERRDDLKGSRIINFRINEDDFHTIKIQLRALGLIVKSQKQRSVKNTGTYWTLTPYGDEVMTRLRAIPARSISSG